MKFNDHTLDTGTRRVHDTTLIVPQAIHFFRPMLADLDLFGSVALEVDPDHFPGLLLRAHAEPTILVAEFSSVWLGTLTLNLIADNTEHVTDLTDAGLDTRMLEPLSFWREWGFPFWPESPVVGRTLIDYANDFDDPHLLVTQVFPPAPRIMGTRSHAAFNHLMHLVADIQTCLAAAWFTRGDVS